MAETGEFERKLEAQLKPGSEQPSVSYSVEYKAFRDEQLSKARTSYERLCRFSSFFKARIKDEKKADLESYINLAHISITPESAYSLAYLVTAVLLLLSIASFFLFGLGLAFLGLIATFTALLLLPKVPKYIYNSWRAKASDQLVLAVLYMVIYMKRDANLENAIWFVSKQLPPPISLDFMKILWDLETKTYSTVRESLESYVTSWKDKESAFVDAMHLIEASLSSPTKEQTESLLTKATDVILQGTQDSMIKYAHSLQGPVTMIHMLGIVLPILLLVMLPMVSAFMGDIIKPIYLVLGYNVFLPLLIFALISSVVQLRPGGATIEGVDIFKKAKQGKGVNVGRLRVKFPLRLVFTGVFVLFLVPFVLYLLNAIPRFQTTQQLLFSDGLFYFSLFIVAGLGISIGLYYRTLIGSVLKQKRKTEKLESEFAAAIFQLGSRLQENIPAEIAFGTVAKATKGTEVSEFFEIVDQNMRQRGMSLKAAIFDAKQGALAFFPSSTIRSVMNLLIEGVKKSPQAVAESLLTISTYLTDMHRVSERLKDLLAETIASIKMQATFLAAAISGIVVSLTILITRVLVGLGEQLSQIPSETAGAAGPTGIVSFFRVESAIPPYLFQLMVGVYVVEVVILLSFLLGGVIYGRDFVEIRWEAQKNLLIAVPLYIAIAIVATFFFSQIAGAVIGA